MRCLMDLNKLKKVFSFGYLYNIKYNKTQYFNFENKLKNKYFEKKI